MRVRRRLLVLSAVSSLGMMAAVELFRVPSEHPPRLGEALAWMIGTLVTALAAWAGLRWADAANLPMPLLRKWEGVDVGPPPRSALVIALVGGGVMAALGILLVRAFHVPDMGGPLVLRAASTLFAAVTLEMFLHLALMSGVVRLTRSTDVGIAAAALAYVVFHGAGATSLPFGLLSASVAMNGCFGIFLGWLYARFGFEYLVLAHAVAHLLAVTLS